MFYEVKYIQTYENGCKTMINEKKCLEKALKINTVKIRIQKIK